MTMGGSSHAHAPVDPAPLAVRTTRRTFLAGAGVAGAGALGTGLAVEGGLLPGGDVLRAVLGRNGGTLPIPDVPRGTLVSGSFASPARLGAQTGWTICWPHGIERGTPLPVLVMLHGHASDHTAAFEGLGMDRFLTQAVRHDLPPFAIASVDGGRDYWKPAPDGSDAGRMVVDELVPLLADHGLDTATMSIGGWSMGGYGSLRIAGLGLLPVRSVATFAPALHYAEDADDVLRNPQRLRGMPVQVSVGRGDLFWRVDRQYVAALRAQGVRPEVHTGPGGHTQRFWRTFVPGLLRFTARHLTA
jgi:S-formylglutathione hydrolase FrmB